MASDGYTNTAYTQQPYAQGTYVATAEAYPAPSGAYPASSGAYPAPSGAYPAPSAPQMAAGLPMEVPGPQIIVVTDGAATRGLQPKPPSHCISAWISCIFCCWPIGLFAIYNSFQVDQLFNMGNYEGALRASERAKVAANIAIIFGLLVILISSISGASAESSTGRGNS